MEALNGLRKAFHSGFSSISFLLSMTLQLHELYKLILSYFIFDNLSFSRTPSFEQKKNPTISARPQDFFSYAIGHADSILVLSSLTARLRPISIVTSFGETILHDTRTHTRRPTCYTRILFVQFVRKNYAVLKSY